MPTPSREDYLAARAAARDCATAAGWLLRAAAGRPEPTGPGPAVSWRGTTESLVAPAVEALGKALDEGRGKIPPVAASLLLAAGGRVSTGGMTRSTAHGLAWDYAHRLWLAIGAAAPGLRPDGKGGGFPLDADIMREAVDAIRRDLLDRPSFDASALVAEVELESSKAIAMLEEGSKRPGISR